MNYIYADDLLTSFQNSEQAVQLQREVGGLKSVGFQMTKYASNCAEVLDAIPNEFLAPQLNKIDFHDEELSSYKTLDLAWDSNSDTLHIKVAVGSHPLTRRGLLSVVASIFDLLGVMDPFMLPAKLLLRVLAKQGLDWDIVIPNVKRLAWQKWPRAQPCLNGLVIPRVHANLTIA